MRTGDTVKHITSGELWTVAWADEREVMPCGWPEGYAKRSDCELIEACTDEEYWTLVKGIAGAGPHPGDSSARRSRCWGLLEQRNAAECAAMMHL